MAIKNGPAGSGGTDPFGEALAALVRKAVVEALDERLDELRPESDATPALLDREGLARALDVSVPSIDKLRRQHPHFPTVWVLDSPRFRLADVLAWLQAHPRKAVDQ